MMDKIDTLNETIKEKSDLMDRAIVHMDRTDKNGALEIVMGWMSIEDIKGMVEFWDESK